MHSPTRVSHHALCHSPENSLLNSTYSALAAALSSSPPPPSNAAASVGSVALLSPREKALSETLIGVISELGEKGLELPWKCFVCVVSMSMLVPLAVNLALQAVVTVYCRAAKLTPDDCVYIRYDMIAFALLITPLEVYPIAEVCVLQHGCK